MGRAPVNNCCEHHRTSNTRRGAWTTEEDEKLVAFIQRNHGHGSWRALPKLSGLQRCGKSCRLRWMNYLRPGIKRGDFSAEEERAIVYMHYFVGNRWSVIAAQLPGRTDNEIKNYWHTHLKKRLSGHISLSDPATHLHTKVATTYNNYQLIDGYEASKLVTGHELLNAFGVSGCTSKPLNAICNYSNYPTSLHDIHMPQRPEVAIRSNFTSSSSASSSDFSISDGPLLSKPHFQQAAFYNHQQAISCNSKTQLKRIAESLYATDGCNMLKSHDEPDHSQNAPLHVISAQAADFLMEEYLLLDSPSVAC